MNAYLTENTTKVQKLHIGDMFRNKIDNQICKDCMANGGFCDKHEKVEEVDPESLIIKQFRRY